MRSAEHNIEQYIKDVYAENLPATTSPKLDERILRNVAAVLATTARADSRAAQPNIWRVIMKSRATRFATVAVIIGLVLIGINQIGGSNVAWAEVLRKVDQALTYTCCAILSDSSPGKEPVELEAVIYASTEHGQKQDVRMNGVFLKHTYFLPAEKVEIDVMPEEKKYRRKPLTDEDIKRRGGDIRETLKKFMACKSKKLGRDKVDGIDVEGIEVCDPNLCTALFTVDSLAAQLWVDVETYLPVLLKAEINGAKGEKTILKADNFQWNIELDSSIFEPNIPSDYEEMK